MTKRENPRRKEREFNKFQEKTNRGFRRDSKVISPAKETNIDALREDLILGRNAVIEALKSDRTIECLYVSKGDLEGSIKVALGLARDKGVVVKEVDRRKLDTMCEGLNHQGIVAKVTPFKYCEVNDILEVAEKKGEKPFSNTSSNVNISENTNLSDDNISKEKKSSTVPYSISANQNKNTDSRTYANYDGMLSKMRYGNMEYDDAKRKEYQSKMRALREKWEKRGERFQHSENEDWLGK